MSLLLRIVDGAPPMDSRRAAALALTLGDDFFPGWTCFIGRALRRLAEGFQYEKLLIYSARRTSIES